MIKRIAFTLAEVLITLTVIGVVAVMALPNLVKHYEKKTLETQTKHFYSMMSLAIENYMAEHHADELYDTPMYCESFEENCENDVKDFVMKHLKVALVCGDSMDNDNNCYSVTAKVLDKESTTNASWGPQFILDHGYAIRLYSPSAYEPAILTVDVNGAKGPNKGGRDIWTLDIFYNGSINDSNLTPECFSKNECGGYPSKEEAIENRFEHCMEFGYDGSGCFGHFKENNFKFDY